MKRLLLGALMAFSACATDPVFVDDNGVAHYSVLCKASKDRCYKKAGKLCPTGWNVVEQTNESGISVSTAAAKSNQFSMLITCKGQGAAAPSAGADAH